MTVVEVAPRDGLQNEARTLSVAARATLVQDLMAAGARRIEVASFVNPAKVPQMADPEGVLRLISSHPEVSFIGLVLNERGARRAAATESIDEINYVVPATDSFGRANQGVTTQQALDALPGILGVASDASMRVSVTVAVAFGCPYDGEVAPGGVVDIVSRLHDADVDEIALADTIGCAVPADVRERFGAARERTHLPLRAHFHETRRTGLANVQAALDEGVRTIDASVAGLGGCPFAPGAAGNVATEDVAWMLERTGMSTGLDVSALAAIGRAMCDLLGTEPRSGVGRVGSFPRASSEPVM